MERINYLDGLKGLSALVVVLGHCCATFGSLYPKDLWLIQWPFIELQNGKLAVFVFVAMSAMLMTYITREEKRWPSVVVKRYLRFLFPISFVVLIAITLQKLGWTSNNQLGEYLNNNWLMTQSLSLWEIFKAIVRSPWGGLETVLVLNVFWMLRFVFFCPFIIILLQIATRGMKPTKKFLFVALCMIVSKFFDSGYIPVFFGYILVEALPYVTINTKWWWVQVLAFIGLYYLQNLLPIDNNSLSCVLRTMLIVCLVATCIPIQKMLSWKPLVWIGGISFEIYLVHLIVIYTITCRMYLILPYFPHRLSVIILTTITMSVMLA